MSHNVKLSLQGGGWNVNSGGLTYNEKFGKPGAADGSTVLTEGNGSYQGNQTYKKTFSIPAAGTLYIDLRDGTDSPKDVLNNALALNTVKAAYVEVTDPNGNKTLKFGPAGNAAVAPLFMGNNTQSVNIFDKMLWTHPVAGWTLGAGVGNIGLRNTGTETITGELRITGVKQ